LYENPGDCSGGEWRGMGGEKRKGSGIGEVKGFVIIVSTEASEREREVIRDFSFVLVIVSGRVRKNSIWGRRGERER